MGDEFIEAAKEALQSAPPAEITEEVLAEIAGLREQEKAIKARLDILTESVRLLAPTEERKATLQCGSYIVSFTRTSSTRVDYEAYLRDQMGEDAIREIREIREQVARGEVDSKFVKRSDALRVDVFKVNGPKA